MELGRVLHFDQAEAAGADIRQPIEMTERRDEDIVLARNFQHSLVGAGADVDAVDNQGFDIHGGAHTVTSSSVRTLLEHAQTPAGQRLLSMCSRYSSLK